MYQKKVHVRPIGQVKMPDFGRTNVLSWAFSTVLFYVLHWVGGRTACPPGRSLLRHEPDVDEGFALQTVVPGGNVGAALDQLQR